jgi:ABC-type molybdate transport system substrate-binding protein
VIKDSKSAPLARGFVDYILSPAGQNVLAGFGFSKP